METDISKRTIMILVVLTLFISVFSFFTVVKTMNARAEYNMVSTPDQSNVIGGKVSLGVKEQMQPVETTGHISLKIIN